MTKRCIQLIRVSTESQAADDRASIPSQKAINQRTANAFGLSIVRTVQMSDVSGTAVLRAPEMLELLEWIKDSEIHGVVAREFSRLMRPEDFSDYYILQVFADTKTVLYLPEGPIDFSNKMGRVYGVMQAAWAGAQRMEFLENAWNSKEMKRREGGFSQSAKCLPFGVTFKDGKWSYTPESEKVKEAYRMFISGETSYTVIARRLNLQPFNVKNMLRNPIYTGTRVIDKKRDPSPAGKYLTPDGRQGGRRKILRAPEDVIRVKILEPLISEVHFQQAQRLIEMKRKNSWRANDRYEHRFIYNGFLLCAKCKDLIYTKYRRDDYYVCKQRCGAGYMRRDRLEPALNMLIGEYLPTTDFAAKIIRALKIRQPQTNVGRVEKQLTALANKRQRILDTYFEGVISSTERDLRIAEIAREQKTLSALITRPEPGAELTPAKLAKLFKPFIAYGRLKRDAKRKLLAALTVEIVAADYKIEGMFIGLNRKHTVVDSIWNEASRLYLPLKIAA
jgi:DNA invertase Pin-like site-specific DNA recombinase